MSTNSSIAAESRKPPEILEQEIDQQRSRIDALIDDVEARLTPQYLIDQALAYGRESGGLEIAERLGQTLKSNPVPVAMTAIGLAWLAVEQTRARAQPATDFEHPEDHESLADALHEAKQSLHQGTFAARQKLHDLADSAETVKNQVKQGADKLNLALHRRPWAFAAAGLALGAVIGILGTARKDEVETETYEVPDLDDGFDDLDDLDDEPPFRPGAI
ncbi:hypothetical protein DNK06_03120 [Pseudomonas daroniae]|uniref:DUF3618 domain-containing protein n=1 Tax=Phytopseudomonas daroniae TaxID=2487519 RepID=A0A4Q9QR79_9GAMM|nr:MULTISPECIES: DUF3618 domain-containing protein [Pseudomonas]TBU83433.1 hypothetical protein DNK06_03120 [Pseudomonas daroniae]TBU85072.1 hypothetical protein DNK31_05500 [Pseudomonas sp. FRB 228]TBU93635.1 hypothetical protein DNJ99_04570 [Pseudomonas daroniae]